MKLKKYLFVGEKRSNRAIKMDVTWKDGRLAASHLFKALEHIGIDINDCEFKNAFEDDINDITNFKGHVIAMGRKVQSYLIKRSIEHEFIFHPAARGTIRKIDNYIAHVENQIKHITQHEN